MFPDLPTELQAEIATYLDTPSLCFFARTSWGSLRTVQSHLMRRQQQLLRSPTIKLVASGQSVFCHTSNVIYACGNNDFGQLGLGHTNRCTTLTRLERQPLGFILQVVTSASHTLVLTDQGLYACGYNGYGQLGLGHNNVCTTLKRLPQQPSGLILQVIAGQFHTLVLTDQGLYACGDNNHGQLGLAHTNGCTTTLTRLPQQPPRVILQVMAGQSHTLVLTDQGLYACGNNNHGQLGLAHRENYMALTRLPQQPPGLILQVAAGESHTLVLTNQGLYACGSNNHGQLGLGHTENYMTLTRLSQQPPGLILQVVAGESHTLVLTDQGLYTCGDNRHGQLGLGYTTACMILTRLPQQPSGVILQVMASKFHNLVLTDQGLYACGENSYSQLGLRHTNDCMFFRRLKQQPPGVILQVVTSEFYTLVLTDQGLYACGNNRYGQLGLGHTNARMTLTLVNQVPLELQQFQTLYRQLNALIRLSQTENSLLQPERLNLNGNSLPQAKKSSRTEIDELEPSPKRTKFFP